MPSPSTAAASTAAAWAASASGGASKASARWHCELPAMRRARSPPSQAAGGARLSCPGGSAPKAAVTARKKSFGTTGPAAATTKLAAVYCARTYCSRSLLARRCTLARRPITGWPAACVP